MQPSYAPGYLAIIASTAFGRIGAGMIAGPGFSVPHEIDEILERLPPQVTLNVPDHVLVLWFPREPADGTIDARTLERARRYAQSCGCAFVHHQSIREGVFYRPLPPRE
jgi:hypothetical protein